MKQSRAGKPGKIIKKIDRYEIRDELGQGGMATVYYAYDPRVGREIAIKVLLKEFMRDPLFRERFEREVKSIATLEHPAIVPVYDYGEDDGQPYLVMRFMSGGTLEDKIKIGAMSLPDAGVIVARVGSALEQAHSRGIVHRDLKPGNILFDQYGNAFLSDFGIVKLASGNKTLTEAGGMVGTPAYMSPEQVQGASNIDGRADIYALGVILFEMLSGTIPYNADTPMGVAVMQVTEPVPRIRATVPGIPKKIETVISKSMAKNRDQRYQNVGEMVEAVLSVTGSEGKSLMESGTFQSPVAGGSGRGGRPTNTNIAPAPTETVELGHVVIRGKNAGTDPAKSTRPLPGFLKDVPVWAWAGIGMVALIIVGALALGEISGGDPTPTVPIVVAATEQGGTTPPPPVDTKVPIVVVTEDGPAQILFDSDRQGNPAFFLMNTDGSNLSKLLVDNMNNRTPDWSPDGTKIAYRCQDNTRRYVCVINADGAGRKTLTDDSVDNYAPVWSPDGSKLLFVSERDNNTEIYVMNADGSGQTRLTTNGSGDFDPSWSPDGKQIVFSSNRPSGSQTLWIMNADGSNQVALTKEGIPNYKPDWSPDGKSIVFVSERDGNPEIYLMRADGLNHVRLTNNEAADVSPVWSHDGTQILFSSRRDGQSEIYVMNADGSSQTRLTEDPADDLDPVWKP